MGTEQSKESKTDNEIEEIKAQIEADKQQHDQNMTKFHGILGEIDELKRNK